MAHRLGLASASRSCRTPTPRSSCRCTRTCSRRPAPRSSRSSTCARSCAEKQYEFAFLGFPLKLRGATGSPLRPIAVPLRS